jgi:hypothetical protein
VLGHPHKVTWELDLLDIAALRDIHSDRVWTGHYRWPPPCSFLQRLPHISRPTQWLKPAPEEAEGDSD